MINRVAEAEKLFKEYQTKEAEELLSLVLFDQPDNKEALLLMGKIHSRTQNFGEAMNCFQKVLIIDPHNSDAQIGIQLIKNILQLTNNYYFENPYTDDDLYEIKT